MFESSRRPKTTRNIHCVVNRQLVYAVLSLSWTSGNKSPPVFSDIATIQLPRKYADPAMNGRFICARYDVITILVWSPADDAWALVQLGHDMSMPRVCTVPS